MGGPVNNRKPVSRVVALAASSALACLFAMPNSSTAFAQSVEDLAASAKVAPDARLLLVADELIYDNGAETVTASGNVQIDYGGNKLVAKERAFAVRDLLKIAGVAEDSVVLQKPEDIKAGVGAAARRVEVTLQ